MCCLFIRNCNQFRVIPSSDKFHVEKNKQETKYNHRCKRISNVKTKMDANLTLLFGGGITQMKDKNYNGSTKFEPKCCKD